EDRVHLPRLYMAWPTPPYLSPPDAALTALAQILATGKTSRLYRKLVYELQVAQDVTALQDSSSLSSVFEVVVTAREGHPLEEIRSLVDAEIARLLSEPPTEREVGRVQNQNEAQLFSGLERIAGADGRGDQMNNYLVATGDPDYFQEDLARFRALSPSDIQAVAQTFLGPGRVLLSVVPSGHTELALPGAHP
ncbi:MAG TPA: insulinase family protein, partial [Vicinamibacteria bacterium]|nr:insulinase family protein [Vicinamibacteria bacterium]